MTRPPIKSVSALYWAMGTLHAAQGCHRNPFRRELQSGAAWQSGHDAYMADAARRGAKVNA